MASPTVDRSVRNREVALLMLAKDASDVTSRLTPEGVYAYVSISGSRR